MMEVSRREKQAGILPDSDVDAYMKAISVEGLKSNLQTDYILKILGLDICADTMAGDAMRRGISGGQKKRLTTVDQFGKKFKESQVGKNLEEEISKPFDKSKNQKGALSLTKYSLTKWELFKACSVREFLLMKRNSFIYIFKTTQLLIIASITMTVLLRTRMAVDAIHASYYMGALFYGLIILLVDGFPETQMTVSRLAVFYKHRELCFYPAWAYAIPSAILKVPVSLLEAFVWTTLTYYVIGYSPEFGRFLRQFLLLFLVHLTSTSMFRFVASVLQTAVASTAVGSLTIVIASVFGGFVIAKPAMPVWLAWGFWISPLTYGEIGLTVNEFLAPRWEKVISGNTSIGQQTLESRGLNFHGYFYWISVGALIGMTVLLNIGFTMALTFLKPPGNSRAIISREKYNQLQGKTNDSGFFDQDKILTEAPAKSSTEPKKGVLVFFIFSSIFT
ncbi:PLEIOTROPIC DRUG RESISTANCE PROTEIN 1-LIKE ISOFORM X1 [Salix koriyanagi]|uniref:PLEIOTROPIC DRUG RESISTANCE PROTEIN 1-LIKE ISOFORM X1 n=2 Tax=Salix TaxID=40685 RepID=A0A9Q0PG58_9ROSI|nr:PLEIOTROPIC DRUG RESISTANCE PROTEIN 1-LIKE ISOFORM X1 [Salix koriyanagi]